MLSLCFFFHAFAADVVHLSLDEAMAAMEAHHPGLARAEAQQAQVAAAKVVALSATLPTLSANGSYTRNNEEASLDLGPLFEILGQVAAMTGQEAPVAPDPMVLQPLSSLTAGASLRVPLVVPSAWVGINAAGHSLDAADASLAATQSNLRATAMMAIWGEAAAEAFVVAQVASVDRARQLVQTAENSVKNGNTAPLALLQAQTDLARREGDALQAQANLDKARIAVGVALGQNGPVAVDLPATTTAEVEAVLEVALSHRGEILAAQAQVEAAQRQLLAIRLGALPTVSGGFNVFASSEPYVTGENTGWKASVDLNWLLVQGGLRSGNAQKAEAALADAEAALDAIKLQVTQQFENAQVDMRVARQRLEVAGRQRQLAEEALRVAQHSFDAGLGDATPVLDALDRLDLARASEIDAQARVGMAQVSLQAAVGQW